MGKKKRSRPDGEDGSVEKKQKKKDKTKPTEEASPAPEKPASEGSLLSKAMAMAKTEGIPIVAALTKLKSGTMPDSANDKDAKEERKPSPSPAPRRRSPSPVARRRSPSPVARRRSPSPVPVRRRSPSPQPVRRRSPSPQPVRRRSPSPPVRRRSFSPPPRRRSPSPRWRSRSPPRRSPPRRSPELRRNNSDSELKRRKYSDEVPKEDAATGALKQEVAALQEKLNSQADKFKAETDALQERLTAVETERSTLKTRVEQLERATQEGEEGVVNALANMTKEKVGYVMAEVKRPEPATSAFLQDVQGQASSLLQAEAQDFTSAQDAVVLQPWCTGNVYEQMGDVLSVWNSLLIEGVSPSDVDLHIPGDVITSTNTFPLNEIWKHLFRRVVYGEDLRKGPQRYKRVVIVPYGGLSTMTENGGRGGDVTCKSPLVRGLGRFINAAYFNVAYPRKEDRQKVTYCVREPHDDRHIQNGDEIEAEAKRRFPSDWSIATFDPYTVKQWKQQLDIARQSTMLWGVHGQCLGYMVFMAPGSSVLELSCGDRGMMDKHYQNLATQMGHAHQRLNGHQHECEFSPKDVTDALLSFLDTARP